ncbi:MBL fold metallo-hydrolase [Chengkuizengella axinellae]|uniref:MBL fold metallo-hydrolase n=1 Tax=Chengkuizengella axinellae TaxID=3064388 RepID=A0ABT9IZT3_9BACL|nr:MBL fold metallo-hydrolase [Chengkuizengella sp. 2205SS18-9]MDP5274835.1 MBL fold metallo-hydrolase [Chengkuizengella sp. 2205SS18-9]
MSYVNFHALNVGRGDAFVLEIMTVNETPYIVVVDGGDDLSENKITPTDFINEKKWSQIDLLILTHLHHDHVVGLLRLADEINIKQAVVPYPSCHFNIEEMTNKIAKQSKEVIELYQQLLYKLENQDTQIQIRPPFGLQKKWSFGEFTLNHIYPETGDPLPAFEIIEDIKQNHMSLHEKNEKLAKFDVVSNSDSSVWMLENEDKEQLLLLGGDALLPIWRKLVDRYELSPQGFKISHHGMKDAMDEVLLKQLAPTWALITNQDKEYQMFKDEWIELMEKVDCKLLVTCDDPNTKWITSQLPKIPIRER